GARDERKRPRPGRIRRLGPREPVADARIGAAGMQHALDRGHLPGPLVGRTRGPHRLLAPAQPAGQLRKRTGPDQEGHEVPERAHLAPRMDWTTGYCTRCRARRIRTQTATAPSW